MGIAAELAKPAHPRESGAEIGQETARGAAIAADGVGTQRQGERPEVSFKDPFEGLARQIGEGTQRVRCWTARAYSRQTSWGASWT